VAGQLAVGGDCESADSTELYKSCIIISPDICPNSITSILLETCFKSA